MRKLIAIGIITSLLSVLALPVQAAMLTTEQLLNSQAMTEQKSNINQLLLRDDVQNKLAQMGVSSADIEQRLASLTNQEIMQLSQQIDNLPAGGDVLGLVVLIFLVFVITDSLGATDIFSFVHPIE